MRLLLWGIIFSCCQGTAIAQLAEVQANYNSVGDVDFIAYNYTAAPLFVNIDFADLQNTTFNETLPYIKMLEPGFNSLFTLQREPGADVPRFNHQIRIFKSNPWSIVDLNFPYLLPLASGIEATVPEVTSLAGFTGTNEPSSWHATGFKVNPGQEIYAARTGIVVEIAGNRRDGDPQTWYNWWNNSVTVLQPDGTLITYKNVVDIDENLRIGQKVYAAQVIGKVARAEEEIILVIFQHSISSPDLRFIIPQFVSEGHSGVLLSNQKYIVTHPPEIRGREMTNREKRRLLK